MHEDVCSVLIVDDEWMNIKMLKIILEKQGYCTVEAQNGQEAYEKARTNHPDLVLLDIMMPGESGFETCAKLKQDAGTADIPVIFISALDDVDSKVNTFNQGGVDYISKPFQKEEVLARVRTHLKLHLAYNRIIKEQASKLAQVREAQEQILTRPEEVPLANFGVYFLPVLEAGGDFYDVFRIGSENIWGYFVADISGHDLGSSFATSALKALIRQNSSPIYSQLESVQMINRVLENNFPRVST